MEEVKKDLEVVEINVDGELHKFYLKDGWIVNPNERIVKGILKGLKKNDGKCPCHHPDNDGDLTCPCESYRLRNKCCCKLYILKQ